MMKDIKRLTALQKKCATLNPMSLCYLQGDILLSNSYWLMYAGFEMNHCAVSKQLLGCYH